MAGGHIQPRATFYEDLRFSLKNRSLEKAVGNPTEKSCFTSTELWHSLALGQCKIAQPGEEEPTIEYPLSGA